MKDMPTIANCITSVSTTMLAEIDVALPLAPTPAARLQVGSNMTALSRVELGLAPPCEARDKPWTRVDAGACRHWSR